MVYFFVNRYGTYQDIHVLTHSCPARSSSELADGTLCWSIGYARTQSPTAEERFIAWGYPELTDGTNTAFLIGGAKPYVKSNELKRDGVMAVVEWEPSDRFHRSEEHTSELQSLMRISYAVFCLKKKKIT